MSKAKIYINGAWVDLGGDGLTVRGTYDAASTYQKTGTTMDVVQYNGSLWGYINAVASSGNTPPESSQTVSNDYWTLLVAKGDDAPELKTQYSVDGSTLWHDEYAEGDVYMRTSSDNGKSWSGAIRILGKQGIAGISITEHTESAFAPVDGAIYKHTIVAGETIELGTTNFTADRCATFELWLTMGDTVVSFSLPDNLVWVSSAPIFGDINTLYALVIRWDGSGFVANMAYSKEVTA